MKYFLYLFVMWVIFSCKKENQAIIPISEGAFNKIEGDIIWGGINSTHFISQPADLSPIYASFFLDTVRATRSSSQIRITGFQGDTGISVSIINLNLKTPGIYNFRDLDSNHSVMVGLNIGYNFVPPPTVYYDGVSYANEGMLTIDSISKKHISGNISAYCNRLNLTTNLYDTNEVHLNVHFSGDFQVE